MRQPSIIYTLILLNLLFSSPALAAYAEDDPNNPPDLFCQSGAKSGGNPAFGGKPVSLYSGMETFAPSTDITLGSIYPISITRSYNSKTTYDSPWAMAGPSTTTNAFTSTPRKKLGDATRINSSTVPEVLKKNYVISSFNTYYASRLIIAKF